MINNNISILNIINDNNRFRDDIKKDLKIFFENNKYIRVIRVNKIN